MQVGNIVRGARRRRLAAGLVALGVGAVSWGMAAGTTSAASKQLNVDVMLFGSANDGSWNQSMATAVTSLEKKDNLKVHFVANVSQANATRALVALASTHPDLIIAHAYEFGTALDTVASRFPTVDFLQGSPSDTTTFPNVEKYDMRPSDASYLAGMAAAAVSKHHAIAVTGGVKQPGLTSVADAFVLGAKAIDPTIKNDIAYVGSYEDPVGGKQTSTAQIGQGADVIYELGDGTAVGTDEAIQAARAQGKNVLAVGAYYDLHNNFPSFSLTSVQYNWGVAVQEAVTDMRNGKFGKKTYLITSQNGGQSDSPYYQFAKLIPAADMAKIKHVATGFANGSFKLPPALANAD